MYQTYPEIFQRDMACTPAQWLHWLPQALGDVFWKLHDASAGVRLGDGALGLKWQEAPPRVIGLVQMPRLLVDFRFAGVDDATRNAFMQRFDLYMQRGGG
ncbi:MAG: hypothetical protein AUJ20_08720 [Comamonadaceae bacterium CG1_02_60_18]|nr:MAG: hypothetical protein AUJ20_08720 [Comamonadaceae bacterium CG1_02_60_18]PIQ51576.1 MAG: hypothetical protein COW02_14090 [Comamonadaceae bacterium CG12_big_fil_rev_8_21_14_0_65_59_15]